MTKAMQKTTRNLTILIILTQILATTLCPTTKVTATPYIGTQVGDYFTYGKFNIWMDPPTSPLIDEWQQFKDIKSINFTMIPNAFPGQYNTVSFEQKLAFKNNNTERIINGSIELPTGLGQGFLFFIYAGLEKGEKIYPQSTTFNWTISETRTHPRWGGNEICVYNNTNTWWNENILYYRSTIIYWDKHTGVLIQVHDTIGGYGGPLTPTIEGSLDYELSATNREIPIPQSGWGEMTPVYIMIIVVLIVAFTVLVVRLSTSTPKKKWKRLKK